MSMSNMRWCENTAEDKVRYTGNGKSSTNTISKTSRVAEELYRMEIGEYGPKIKQEFSTALSRMRLPRLVFSRELQTNCLALRPPAIMSAKSSSETGGKVRSHQWAGRGEVSRRDFHRSLGILNLDDSSPRVGQVRNGHSLVDYTMAVPTPLSGYLCDGRHNWQAGRLDQG